MSWPRDAPQSNLIDCHLVLWSYRTAIHIFPSSRLYWNVSALLLIITFYALKASNTEGIFALSPRFTPDKVSLVL